MDFGVMRLWIVRETAYLHHQTTLKGMAYMVGLGPVFRYHGNQFNQVIPEQHSKAR